MLKANTLITNKQPTQIVSREKMKQIKKKKYILERVS